PKISERKVAGPDPLEFDHRMTHPIEHASYLAFSALVDRDLKPGVCLFLPDLLDLCRRGPSVFKIDTLLEIAQRLCVNHTLYLRQICLRKLMLWVSNQVGKITIVRHEQQPLGIVVKPPHGIDTDLDAFQQI